MHKPTPCDACGVNACEPDDILCPGCKPGNLHQRIARVLGWTETEAQSFALPTLRAMVRDKYPKLAHDITIAMGRITTDPCPAIDRLTDIGCQLPRGHNGQHKYIFFERKST